LATKEQDDWARKWKLLADRRSSILKRLTNGEITHVEADTERAAIATEEEALGRRPE
jgi:hypothetical protein